MIRTLVVSIGLALGAIVMLAGCGQSQASRALRVERRTLSTQAGAIPVRIAHDARLRGGAPLVLLLPGWGEDGARLNMLQDALATRGHLVVSMPDVAFFGKDRRQSADEMAVRYAAADLSTVAGIAATRAQGDPRVALAARALSAVLSTLLQDDSLAPMIDRDRIGVVGYSFGGATALSACISDRRIKSVVNLDGWLFGDGAQHIAACDYLLILSREAAPPSRTPDSESACALEAWRLRDLALQQRYETQPGSLVLMASRTSHHDLGGPFPSAFRIDQQDAWGDRLDAIDAFLKSPQHTAATPLAPRRLSDLVRIDLRTLDAPTKCAQKPEGQP